VTGQGLGNVEVVARDCRYAELVVVVTVAGGYGRADTAIAAIDAGISFPRHGVVNLTTCFAGHQQPPLFLIHFRIKAHPDSTVQTSPLRITVSCRYFHTLI
jgi:hypothetical protein